MVKAKPRTGELTTANFGWVKPTVGASDDAWGGYINADLDGIDSTVYGIQSSIPTVPTASATQPVMDGLATAGNSAQWSRGDHVHPTDTSRYAASNPSGYQTAANVTASLAPYALTTSLASYLPLAGGTLTGPIKPAGIVGTTTNDNAAAGQIGEVISSVVLSPGVTLTNGTSANVTSISLTAGDWDVSGEIWIAAGTGAPTFANMGVGSATAGITSTPAINQTRVSMGALLASATEVFSLKPCRVSLASTTPYYLVAQVGFPSGTTTAYGVIWARRAR